MLVPTNIRHPRGPLRAPRSPLGFAVNPRAVPISSGIPYKSPPKIPSHPGFPAASTISRLFYRYSSRERVLVSHAASPQDLLSALSWRYATKKFDPARKIDASLWSTLEQALVLSPSSFGLQPWRFVVVTDPATRQKLRTVSWNQPQITDASHLVVFCRKNELTAADVDAYINRVAQVRGTPKAELEGYRTMILGSVTNPPGLPGGDMVTYTRSQVYIALGQFLTAAALLGIDACPMEGFDPKGYNEILNLPAQGYSAVVVATAGYRAADDMFATMKKVRFEAKDVIRRV